MYPWLYGTDSSLDWECKTYRLIRIRSPRCKIPLLIFYICNTINTTTGITFKTICISITPSCLAHIQTRFKNLIRATQAQILNAKKNILFRHCFSQWISGAAACFTFVYVNIINIYGFFLAQVQPRKSNPQKFYFFIFTSVTF